MGSVPNSFVFEPSVAALSSGGSVVTWIDGLDDGVFAQKLDAHGSLVGSQLTVTTAQGSAPDVAPLASDGFVVVWDGGFDVVARIYNGSSNPVTNAFVVNDSSTNAQHSASVATLGNGKFVVIWLLDGGANETIKGQVFNADGTRSGSEFTVSTNAARSSVEVMPPKVTALGSDEFVVTWDNVGTTDGVNNTIHAQIFSSAIVGSPPVANSDTHAVVEYATTSGNVISGTTGGDVADTDSDGDTLTVTAITGANGAGTVGTALAGAKGTLTIHADGSYSYAAEHTQPLAVGATVQDQFTYTVDDGHGNTDSATLTVSITGAATGTPGNDWLLGGATGGTLDGKGGHDTLTGGPAGDSFRFDGALNAANLAHITNFVHGADKIALSGHIFENKVGSHLVPIKVAALDFYAAAHATKARAAGDRIIYNKTTGALYFDPDGTGPKHAVEFAVLDTHPALTFHDFMMVA
jgi:VCBS repeat-containing protein